MQFKFQCPHCSASLNAKDEWRGKKATCKSCGQKLTIPIAETAQTAPAAPVQAAPVDTSPVQDSPVQAAPIIAEPVQSLRTAVEPASVRSATQAINPVIAELVAVKSRSSAISDTSPSAQILQPFSFDDATPTASSAPIDESTAPIDAAEIQNAIRGKIQPVETTIGYRIAVVPVALLMIILPIVYLALIVAVGYFTCWYAVRGFGVFEGLSQTTGRSGRGHFTLALIMYTAPLFASVLTLVFLIKPFFARASGASAEVQLKPEQQTTLFRFVELIASAVHAPKPNSIVVDTEVNASAAFRRGWWSLFRRSDLELTIGLPLVERLTAQELAGVLAHEFGHFSQGLGMRLQYVVRSISMWFARVVYERDWADEWLAGLARNVDIRLGIIVYFTMFMIWLSRRVLWLLMMIGNGFSSILLRQMEYDADQHEIRLAGSDNFASTARKLMRLGLAYQESALQAQHSFSDGRLVNHLPGMVALNFDQQKGEAIKALEEHEATEKSSWFDTHPLNRDRIAQAKKSANPGIMKLNCDARLLFSQYDAVAKQATREFYVEVFEDSFKDSMLTDVHQVQTLMESSKSDYEARVSLLGEEFTSVRPIPLSSPQRRPDSLGQIVAKLQAAQKSMAADFEEFKKDCKSLEETESRWIVAFQAMSLQSCGIKFKEKIIHGIPVNSAEETKQVANQLQHELGALHHRLSKFESNFGARVDATMQYLWHCADANQPVALEQRERMTKALAALASQFRLHTEYVSLKKDFNIIVGVFTTIDTGDLSKQQRAQVDQKIAELKATATRICRSLVNVAYPFDHSRGDISLAQYLTPNGLKLDETDEVCETTANILENFETAFIRSLGVLCAGIFQAEKHLNESPLPEQQINSPQNFNNALSTSAAIAPQAISTAGSFDVSAVSEVVEACEVVEDVPIASISSDLPLDFAGQSTRLDSLASPASATPYAATSYAAATTGLNSNAAPVRKSRRWIWVTAIVAGIGLFLVCSIVVAIAFSKYYLANSKQTKEYTRTRRGPDGKIIVERFELPVTPNSPNTSRGNNPLANNPLANDPTRNNPARNNPSMGPTGFQPPAGMQINPAPPSSSQQSGQNPTNFGAGAMVNEMLNRVKSNNEHERLMGLSFLSLGPIDPSRRREVLQVLRERIKLQSGGEYEDRLVDAFCHWSDESCKDELIELKNRSLRKLELTAIVKAMSRIKDPELIPHLVECLQSNWAKRDASEALKQYGDQIVPQVWEAFTENKDFSVSASLLELLEVTGNADTIEKLEAITQSRPRDAALIHRCIVRIKTRLERPQP